MIKAVVFDIGGVLVDQKLLLDKLVRIFKPRNRHDFWRELNLQSHPLCKNEISHAEYWKRVSKSIGIEYKKSMKTLWNKEFDKLTKINQKLMGIVKRLKPKYKLALLSNSIEAHSKINRKRGLYRHFDEIILSHEVRLAKDKKAIFILAAKKLNVEPSECVYIDDVKDFIKVAISAGMKGIVFKNPGQLNRDLGRMLK